MSKIDTTCGIFLFHGNELLICHPTGASMGSWSIPKGVNEDGEQKLDTALREFSEETGVNVSDYASSIIPIGERDYRTKKKRICGFIAFCDKDKPESFICSSLTPGGKPEVNFTVWSNVTLAIKIIHEAQSKLLLDFLNITRIGHDDGDRISNIRKLLL